MSGVAPWPYVFDITTKNCNSFIYRVVQLLPPLDSKQSYNTLNQFIYSIAVEKRLKIIWRPNTFITVFQLSSNQGKCIETRNEPRWQYHFSRTMHTFEFALVKFLDKMQSKRDVCGNALSVSEKGGLRVHVRNNQRCRSITSTLLNWLYKKKVPHPSFLLSKSWSNDNFSNGM